MPSKPFRLVAICIHISVQERGIGRQGGRIAPLGGPEEPFLSRADHWKAEDGHSARELGDGAGAGRGVAHVGATEDGRHRQVR